MSEADPATAPNSGIPLPDTALAALEAAINRLLALDREGAARLTPIQGRVLRVEVAGFDLRLTIVPGDDRLRFYQDYEAEPDCIVRGTPAALLRMGLAGRGEDQVFSGAVEIAGDNRIAQTLGEVLRGLDIDWEEQLARLLGDGLAHRLGNRARAARRWGERSADVLAQDLREYLTEEGRVLPSEAEVDRFLLAVDALRDDVERLQARIERLARQRGRTAAG